MTLPPGTELRPTTGPDAATDIAEAAAAEGFARVVAAGGDGTVHEVANGLLRANKPGVTLGVWPVGSMNDYAFALGLTAWWAAGRDETNLETLAADVGVIAAGGRRQFFVNGVGVGFNGMVTVEARKITWLRGVPLYGLAVFRALAKHFAAPPMSLSFDGIADDAATLALSLSVGRREGGFPLTPRAVLDDGLFDWLRVGDIRRWEMIRYFPGMVTGNIPLHHPKVKTGQCRTAVVRTTVPLCVHADGELVCVPADGLNEVRVELLPGRLNVECYPPAMNGTAQRTGAT